MMRIIGEGRQTPDARYQTGAPEHQAPGTSGERKDFYLVSWCSGALVRYAWCLVSGVWCPLQLSFRRRYALDAGINAGRLLERPGQRLEDGFEDVVRVLAL